MALVEHLVRDTAAMLLVKAVRVVHYRTTSHNSVRLGSRVARSHIRLV